MVELYKRVRGMELEELVAHHVVVQGKLRMEALSRAQNAERILNSAEERTGMSQITVEHENVDWYVNLDDENAMSIEFGRDTGDGGHSRPVEPLKKGVIDG